jgi:creatinine amidohydrolase/Fe(II)-dependent formamide hydrolase-like protein
MRSTWILGMISPLALAGLVAARQPPGQAPLDDAERALRRAEQQRRHAEEMATPRPIAALDTVWIEELTWMEVRDALAAGSRTAIVASGGIEQNGPYLVTGKHNVVLRGACEGIARALGDALCAPILKLVPEGDIDPPSGHMVYPGTLSLRQETFEAVLEDTAASLRAHGFEHVIFIGDSGGNQRGMKEVAERLEQRWGEPVVLYVPEFYRYPETIAYMENELGVKQPTNDGLHDDFAITSMMTAIDPETVRFDQRVAAGKTTINGVSILPKEHTVEVGLKILEWRVATTVEAIRKAIEGMRE